MEELRALATNVDIGWTLVGAALVFFMQAGFAMVETGLTRAKNAGNIVMKNLMDFCIGTPIYWFIGFGIMFGGTGALIGGLDLFSMKSTDYTTMIFQTVFRDDCIRRNGRAYKIFVLLHLQCADQSVCISDFRTLDLGRRMAGAVGIP